MSNYQGGEDWAAFVTGGPQKAQESGLPLDPIHVAGKLAVGVLLRSLPHYRWEKNRYGERENL